MKNYAVRIVDLPYKVKAFTSCEDEFYNIYINARLNRTQQQEAMAHELRHIKNDDFADKEINICEGR